MDIVNAREYSATGKVVEMDLNGEYAKMMKGTVFYKDTGSLICDKNNDQEPAYFCNFEIKTRIFPIENRVPNEQYLK